MSGANKNLRADPGGAAAEEGKRPYRVLVIPRATGAKQFEQQINDVANEGYYIIEQWEYGSARHFLFVSGEHVGR